MLISYYANKKSSPRLPSWQPSLILLNVPIESGSIIKPCTLKLFLVTYRLHKTGYWTIPQFSSSYITSRESFDGNFQQRIPWVVIRDALCGQTIISDISDNVLSWVRGLQWFGMLWVQLDFANIFYRIIESFKSCTYNRHTWCKTLLYCAPWIYLCGLRPMHFYFWGPSQ